MRATDVTPSRHACTGRIPNRYFKIDAEIIGRTRHRHILVNVQAISGIVLREATDPNRKQHRAGFEVITAVSMKNVVFWDIKTEFVLHRRHITSLLQSSAS
jgi:hypothetical protein